MQTITAIHTSGIKLFRNFKKLNPNVIFISIKYEIIKLILYEIIAFLATVLISPNTIPSTIPIRVVDEDKTPVIKRFFVLPRLWNIAPELEFINWIFKHMYYKTAKLSKCYPALI